MVKKGPDLRTLASIRQLEKTSHVDAGRQREESMPAHPSGLLRKRMALRWCSGGGRSDSWSGTLRSCLAEDGKTVEQARCDTRRNQGWRKADRYLFTGPTRKRHRDLGAGMYPIQTQHWSATTHPLPLDRSKITEYPTSLLADRLPITPLALTTKSRIPLQPSNFGLDKIRLAVSPAVHQASDFSIGLGCARFVHTAYHENGVPQPPLSFLSRSLSAILNFESL